MHQKCDAEMGEFENLVNIIGRRERAWSARSQPPARPTHAACGVSAVCPHAGGCGGTSPTAAGEIWGRRSSLMSSIHHHVARCHRPVVIRYVRALHRRLRRRVLLWAAQPSASMPPSAAAAGIFPTVGEEYSGLRSASGGVEEIGISAVEYHAVPNRTTSERPSKTSETHVAFRFTDSDAVEAGVGDRQQTSNNIEGRIIRTIDTIRVFDGAR
jgi:hypothetical protein